MRIEVEFTESVHRSLKQLPVHIVNKLRAWAADVERTGIEEVRKRPGFHDEPLRGLRVGQRSVRLNRAYRAIYIELKNMVRIVRVIEVTRHEY